MKLVVGSDRAACALREEVGNLSAAGHEMVGLETPKCEAEDD